MSPTPEQILDALRTHPQSVEICARVAAVALGAAEQRRPEWLDSSEVPELAIGMLPEVDPAGAATPYGDPIVVLDRGAKTATEWLLLAACVALQVGRTWIAEQSGPDAVDGIAWLAAHTPCNAWLFIDSTISPEASDAFWNVAAERVLAKGVATQWPAVVGVMRDASGGALRFKQRLLSDSQHPTIIQLLENSLPVGALIGEIGPVPARPWWFVLQALTGWLLLRTVGSFALRYGLGFTRSGQLHLDAGNVRLQEERRLLGRTVSRRVRTLPLHELSLLTRQTRYQGWGLYVGLFCLALGTYLGAGMLVDAVRVSGGSPSLLGVGLALVVLGLLLDFVLTAWTSYRNGRTRVFIELRSGRRFALNRVELASADAWLHRVAALRALGG